MQHDRGHGRDIGAPGAASATARIRTAEADERKDVLRMAGMLPCVAKQVVTNPRQTVENSSRAPDHHLRRRRRERVGRILPIRQQRRHVPGIDDSASHEIDHLWKHRARMRHTDVERRAVRVHVEVAMHNGRVTSEPASSRPRLEHIRSQLLSDLQALQVVIDVVHS